MLKTLENFDDKTIEGLLARTAIYINNDEKHAIESNLQNEVQLRNTLIHEICNNININDDQIFEYKSKVLDAIDEELENIDHKDLSHNINNISNQLLIPSDVLNINIIQNIRNFYSNSFDLEYPNIKKTIKDPDRESHLENTFESDLPSDISIFLKKFSGDFPYNNFNLIVIGQRKNIDFYVHQVWRLYDEILDFKKDKTLLDILKNFAEEFGVHIEYKDKVSKFYYSKDAKSKQEFKIKNSEGIKDKNGNHLVTFSHFSQNINKDKKRMSLLVAVDLNKYKGYLKKHKFKI